MANRAAALKAIELDDRFLPRGHYRQTAERLGANRACLSIARKLLKRSYHTLRELGEEALQPA